MTSNVDGMANHWKVKLYELEMDCSACWLDQGTGFVSCLQAQNIGFPALVVLGEDGNTVLLESKIMVGVMYEKQGDSIIMWREKCPAGDVDYALSFQETAGCQAVWNSISEVQEQYKYQFDSMKYKSCAEVDSSADDNMEEYKRSVTSPEPKALHTPMSPDAGFAIFNKQTPDGQYSHQRQLSRLPIFTVDTLPLIKEKLSSVPVSQREYYALSIAQDQFSYLKDIITLFFDMQKSGEVEKMHDIADVMRSVILLNDSSLIEYFICDQGNFLQLSKILEYDNTVANPKTVNYCDFLEDQTGFKLLFGEISEEQLVLLEQCRNTEDLIEVPVDKSLYGGFDILLAITIRRLFRLTYLKDVMMRPNEEIYMGHTGTAIGAMIGFDSNSICSRLLDEIEFRELEEVGKKGKSKNREIPNTFMGNLLDAITHKGEVSRARSSYDKVSLFKNSVRFLRDLFFISRNLPFARRNELYTAFTTNLKDEFFSAVSTVLRLRIRARFDKTEEKYVSDDEIIMICEVLSTFTIICPSILRDFIVLGPIPGTSALSFEFHATLSLDDRIKFIQGQLENIYDHRNLASLFFILLDTLSFDHNNCVLEHMGDVVKILLNTQRMSLTEKESFLALYYDHYLQWTIVTFNFNSSMEDKSTCVLPNARFCDQSESAVAASRRHLCEVLCECIATHGPRFKYFALRHQLISKVLLLLLTSEKHYHLLGLKVFRSVLSVGDEFYHRHISKTDNFKFIINCMVKNIKRDNMLSSIIIEMIEFIRTENTRTLVEHLVTKHGKILQEEIGPYSNVYIGLKARYDSYYDDQSTSELSNGGESKSSVNSKANDLKRRLNAAESSDAYLEGDDDEDDTSSGKHYTDVLSSLSAYSDDDDDELESAFIASNKHTEPVWKKQCTTDVSIGNLVPLNGYQENRMRMGSPTFSNGSPMLDLMEDNMVASVSDHKHHRYHNHESGHSHSSPPSKKLYDSPGVGSVASIVASGLSGISSIESPPLPPIIPKIPLEMLVDNNEDDDVFESQKLRALAKKTVKANGKSTTIKIQSIAH